MITGVNHVGISVASLDRSIGFYRDLFGMEVVVEDTFQGERYDAILALLGTAGRVALLRKGSLQLELFEFKHPTPHHKDPRYPVSDHGISHFCIEVADLDGFYSKLSAAGVYFHCPPIDFKGIAKATYGRDPDGNVFELLELEKKKPAESGAASIQ